VTYDYCMHITPRTPRGAATLTRPHPPRKVLPCPRIDPCRRLGIHRASLLEPRIRSGRETLSQRIQTNLVDPDTIPLEPLVADRVALEDPERDMVSREGLGEGETAQPRAYYQDREDRQDGADVEGRERSPY
jgi:hypothetical protein